MGQPIEAFCEQELAFLEQTVQAFAERYPANAKHLVLEPGRSADPHVDRFIEGFALLAGRIRHKLDSDFPELTESLLQILYPHLALIIPSMAIVQAHTSIPPREQCNGWRLEKDAPLRSEAFGVQGESLQYSLGYPVTIWPIELTQVAWETSPFHTAIRPPKGTVALLRMQFSCKDGIRLDELELEKLRLHLGGERQSMAGLYEILFNRCLGVVFQEPESERAGSAKPMFLPAEECLTQVGLELEDGLLPLPPESFVGYRLLMELLSFPQKFLFADLAGWKQIRGRGFGSQVEVVFFLSQSNENLERGLSAEDLLLDCAPVVNLFSRSTDPIDQHHLQPEYRVVPARRQPRGMEVYRIESVRSVDSDSGKFREFLPFYACSFAQPDQRPAYFHSTRRDSIIEEAPGTEVFVTLIDPEFRPNQASNSVLDIQAWCTNRDLPYKYQQKDDRLYLTSGHARSQGWLGLLRKPTASLRPVLRRGTYWRLLGQNSLNHVSLIQGKESLQALQELLRLCDFSGPATQQLVAINQQIIDGIKSIRSSPVLERVRSSGSKSGMCRGMEVQIEFDEEKYTGTGVFLVASVLERFFAMYTAVNSFTKLTAKTTQAEGYLKKWPPRAAAHRLP